MEQFKIRASACGQIMTNAKKAGELSKTTQTYVDAWLKEKIYGYRKQFSSKQTDKGLAYEDEAIDKAIEWLNLPFVLKNEEKFENDFITGEPDLILEDGIIDIKNSWDCFTFPLFETELPNDDYYWQMQCYMELTGKRKAKVVYVLLTTPETYQNMEMVYDHVPTEQRIKVFEIDYDQEAIEKIKQRVEEIRIYIETKLQTINN